MNKEEAFKDRLEKAAQKQKNAGQKSHSSSKSGMGKNSRLLHIGSEIIGGVIAGFILGYSLDYFLNTKPLFAALFSVLGIFVGLYNAYRYFSQVIKNDILSEEEASQKKD